MELHPRPCGIRITTSPLYHSYGLLGDSTKLAAESSDGVRCGRGKCILGAEWHSPSTSSLLSRDQQSFRF